MSYRLKALAPCTVFVSGRSYRVEAGDSLHLSKSDADQVLSGPYKTRFAVIGVEEDTEAPLVSEQAKAPDSVSNGMPTSVPSREEELYAPHIDSSQAVGLHAPGTTVDPIKDVYDSYKKDGEEHLEKITTPSKPKAPAKRVSKATAPKVETTPTETTEE